MLHNYIYMVGTTIKLSLLFKFWGCGYSYMHLRKHFLDLSLAVTEINIKKQENKKNIKNVKRCRDGMPKSMQTRQG